MCSARALQVKARRISVMLRKLQLTVYVFLFYQNIEILFLVGFCDCRNFLPAQEASPSGRNFAKSGHTRHYRYRFPQKKEPFFPPPLELFVTPDQWPYTSKYLPKTWTGLHFWSICTFFINEFFFKKFEIFFRFFKNPKGGPFG